MKNDNIQINKFICFLSDFKSQSSECEYFYSNGNISDKVVGMQTNDAPLRYFLKNGKIGEDSLIICFVSEKAEKSGSFKNIKRIVSDEKICEDKIIKISCNNDLNESELNDKLNEALLYISNSDYLCIDTTGGFRNAAMMTIALMRFVKVKNFKVTQVIYSNFNTHRIEDVSSLYNVFDLISGIDELVNYGKAKKLKEYYKNSENIKIKDAVQKMQYLAEAFTLCCPRRIDSGISDLKNAINTFKPDEDTESKLFNRLLEMIKNRYSKLFENNSSEYSVNKIKWCLNNDFIQPALAFFVEDLPKYLCKNKIIYINDETKKIISEIKNKSLKYYSEEYIAYFRLEISITENNFNSDVLREANKSAGKAHYIYNDCGIGYLMTDLPNFSKAQIIYRQMCEIKEYRNNISHISDSDIDVEKLKGKITSCLGLINEVIKIK